MANQVARCPHQRQHLSLDRARRKLQRRQLSGPRACTIHDHRSRITASLCADTDHASIRQKHLGDGRPGSNVHTAMAGGFQRRYGECARIHTAFLQINGRQVYLTERGLEFG